LYDNETKEIKLMTEIKGNAKENETEPVTQKKARKRKNRQKIDIIDKDEVKAHKETKKKKKKKIKLPKERLPVIQDGLKVPFYYKAEQWGTKTPKSLVFEWCVFFFPSYIFLKHKVSTLPSTIHSLFRAITNSKTTWLQFAKEKKSCADHLAWATREQSSCSSGILLFNERSRAQCSNPNFTLFVLDADCYHRCKQILRAT
jgi:hypothetical protein